METGIVKAEVVIICKNARRGRGVNESPIRTVTQVYDKEGSLIAEEDPKGSYSIETIWDFLRYKYQNIDEQTHRENVVEYFIEFEKEEE